MENAVLYARVSSKEQETEGFSIPAQIKTLKEYAAKNNFLVVQEFTDVQTAKKAGRKQFNKMLSYLKEKKSIKHLLVEKTDRLFRNMFDYALINDLIEGTDIQVHLAKENVTLGEYSRSNEKFIFGIKALMAKNYSDNLSEEVTKGLVEKAAQGTYPSWAPYGYINALENEKKVIKIDPPAAAYVRRMFELYATGSYSLHSLRKKMLAEGMIYRNGKNFYVSKVEAILKTEFYTGIFYWAKKRYENASHKPIISKELFRRAQEVLRNPYKSKSRKGLFPYTNLIVCGACGYVLTAEIKKEKYIYYHCTGYKGACKQPYIKQEVIEAQFEEVLESIRIPEEIQGFILQGLRESFKDKIEYHNTIVQQLEKQIKVLQNRIDQSYLDKLDNKISEEFWCTHTKKWIEEKDNLSIKLLASQRADADYLEHANIILELADKASGLYNRQDVEQKRRLINILTSNCSYNDGKLDLQLKPVFNTILETVKTGNWCRGSESNQRR